MDTKNDSSDNEIFITKKLLTSNEIDKSSQEFTLCSPGIMLPDNSDKSTNGYLRFALLDADE